MTIRKFSTFILSVIIMIVSIELCARIDDKVRYNAPLFGVYKSSILRSRDIDGVRFNVPGVQYEKWINNRNGFRGREFKQIKSAGTKRIICLGTSETYGLYESAHNEWPAQFASFFNDKPQIEVINASTVGLGLKNYIKYIDKYVLRHQPDIIILFVNPYSYVTGLLRKNKRNNVKKLGLVKEQRRKKATFQIRSIQKIKLAIKDAIPDNLLREYQMRNLNNQIASIEKIRLKDKSPKEMVTDSSVKQFYSDLEQVIVYLKSHNVQVVLSTYPSLIDRKNLVLYPEIFLDARRFNVEYSLEGMIDVAKRLNEAIRLLAEKEEVFIADNDNYIPKQKRYFSDNVHYTDEGAKLIANKMYELVSEM